MLLGADPAEISPTIRYQDGHLLEPVERIEPRGRWLACPEQGAIHLGHETRIDIGGATEHHPVNVLQMVCLRQRVDPAIDCP